MLNNYFSVASIDSMDLSLRRTIIGNASLNRFVGKSVSDVIA